MLTFKLAIRNLFRNTRRTTLTAILISFSLIALIMADGLILGMKDLLVSSLTKNLVGEAQLHRMGFRDNFDVDLYFTGTDDLVADLRGRPEVTEVASRVLSGGMVSSSYNVATGMVFGIDAEAEARIGNIKKAIIEGQYLTGERGEIMLGRPMAELLEVSLGDRIVITLSEADGGDLSQALFRVSGIYYFGLREIDHNTVFINADQARQAVGISADASHELVMVFEDSSVSREKTSTVFDDFNNEQLELKSWMELNEDIATMLELSGLSTLIIGSILFLLASLGVINSMFMSIYERLYEFGVARAIGTTPWQLAQLILCEALLLGIGSCLFGGVIGYGLISYTTLHGLPLGEFEMSGIALSGNIATQMQLSQFTELPFYIILLTLVAALYPARFASKIVPTEALSRSL
ncbi:MAG: FtsX-like permease family protein [Pseudomonadales bacterium]|jgi:ABC-type lipoprotein release transport system permease subunit|nr:FtsX-like permease family protein [Pseudomonadales bacterium]